MKSEVAEATAVYLLILSYIWWLQARAPAAWIMIAVVLVASHAARRESAAELGLSAGRLGSCLGRLGPWVLAVAVVMLIAGWELHSLRSLSPRRVAKWSLYFAASGVVQQYLLNGYFLRRLLALGRGAGGTRFLVAGLFALAHAPNPFLMPVALAGGYLSTALYLRHRNLWCLGLAHAVVAFGLYFMIPDALSHGLHVGPQYWLAP